jgi:hypothetical protein
MKLSLVVATILLAFVGLVGCGSETPASEKPAELSAASDAAASRDLLSGTWELNLSKSTYNPPDLAPKSTRVVYEVVADSIHVVTEGVNAQGKPTHTDYTARFDGTEVGTNATTDGKPNPEPSTASWKKIDDHTYEVSNRSQGQAFNTNRIVIAPDGKSRTSTITGKGAQGQTLNHTVVMDKK